MTFQKFGSGKVLEEEQRGIEKEAAPAWPSEDQKELEQENQK